MKKIVVVFSALIFFGIATSSKACLWDKDTIATEKARVPGVEELVFGNFPRHSQEFYEWRKERSEKSLAANPSELAIYDDLAVAQHKLGDHAAAIETMMRKEKIQPGVYETYSNMGTFYIYTGDLPEAVRCLDKALAINPDAHFGREKYQRWLVEWLLAGKPDAKGGSSDSLIYRPGGYAAFILGKQPVEARKAFAEDLRRESIRGVMGMMRFADFDNPVLLEALGDLLLIGEATANASHHATLAFLHASQVSKRADEQERLSRKFEMANRTLLASREPGLFKAQLKAGLAKGQAFAKNVRADELAWIAAGKDVSAEFEKKYLKP